MKWASKKKIKMLNRFVTEILFFWGLMFSACVDKPADCVTDTRLIQPLKIPVSPTNATLVGPRAYPKRVKWIHNQSKITLIGKNENSSDNDLIMEAIISKYGRITKIVKPSKIKNLDF